MVPHDYVHRIGRTGRAGVVGDAISLVCVDELKLLAEIERLLGYRIPSETISGFEPDRTIRPEPIRLRTGHVSGGGGRRPNGGGRPQQRSGQFQRRAPAARPAGRGSHARPWARLPGERRSVD
jgi:ATP-dependent RNA helicase RhlE